MYDEYKGSGYSAIAINLWQDWSIVRNFASQYTFNVYRDAGSAWNLYNIDNYIPLNYVIDPDGIVRYGLSGTFNESAIRSIIESYLNGISEHTTEFKPIEGLSITPNPANTKSNVKFSLTKAGYVDVRVYSTSGRLVKTVFAGQLNAGTNCFNWNLRDDAGSLVANGIYLYEVVTATGSVRTKASVLR